MKTIEIKSLLLGTVLGIMIVAAVAAATGSTSWEYRWITPERRDFQSEIDKLARDGWELVSAVPDSNPSSMSAVLKRTRRIPNEQP